MVDDVVPQVSFRVNSDQQDHAETERPTHPRIRKVSEILTPTSLSSFASKPSSWTGAEATSLLSTSRGSSNSPHTLSATRASARSLPPTPSVANTQSADEARTGARARSQTTALASGISSKTVPLLPKAEPTLLRREQTDDPSRRLKLYDEEGKHEKVVVSAAIYRSGRTKEVNLLCEKQTMNPS